MEREIEKVMCVWNEGRGAEVGDGDEMSLSEAKREKEKGNLLGFFFLLILFLLILLLLPFVIAGLCLSVLLSPFSSFHLVDWKERLSE